MFFQIIAITRFCPWHWLFPRGDQALLMGKNNSYPAPASLSIHHERRSSHAQHLQQRSCVSWSPDLRGNYRGTSTWTAHVPLLLSTEYDSFITWMVFSLEKSLGEPHNSILRTWHHFGDLWSVTNFGGCLLMLWHSEAMNHLQNLFFSSRWGEGLHSPL